MATSPFSKHLVCWLSLLLGLLIPTDAYAQKIYFTSMAGIFRANLDGTGIECLRKYAEPDRPWGIALDLANNKMYWADYALGKLRRANMDGTAVEDLPITCETSPTHIALDVPHGKVYWSEAPGIHGGSKSMGCIRRGNLDGSEVETLVNDILPAGGITLDIDSGELFWTEVVGPCNHIGRADLDGSHAHQYSVSMPYVTRSGPFLDLAARQIYFLSQDRQPDATELHLQRVSINGFGAPMARWDVEHLSVIKEHAQAADRGFAVALDSNDRRIYWAPAIRTLDEQYDVVIRRANLDGSNPEALVYSSSEIKGIALDLRPTPPSTIRTLLPLLWVAGAASVLAFLGLGLSWRRGRRRRLLTVKAGRRCIDRRALRAERAAKIRVLAKLGGVCAAACVWILWGLSTCMAVDYRGWRSDISLRSGTLGYGWYTQWGPDYMAGRTVLCPGQQPRWGWSASPLDFSMWRRVLSNGSWSRLASLLGLGLPGRDDQPRSMSPTLYRMYLMPIWVPCFLLTALAVFLSWRDRRRLAPGHCRSCGYDLTGNLSGICPECGVPTGGKILPISTIPPANQHIPDGSADDRSQSL